MTQSLDRNFDWEAIVLRRRGIAGLWSARFALVLSMPFAIVAWIGGVSQAWLLFMVLPGLAAFFSGALFGAAILDPARTTKASTAGARGLMVALGAYLFLALELAVMSANPLAAAVEVLARSMLLSGWLVLPAGFLAGIVTFRARQGAARHRRADWAEDELAESRPRAAHELARIDPR